MAGSPSLTRGFICILCSLRSLDSHSAIGSVKVLFSIRGKHNVDHSNLHQKLIGRLQWG